MSTKLVRAVDLTTRLRKVIGCPQTPGASRRRALRGFFPAKKVSKSQIHVFILKLVSLLVFVKETLVVYHDQGHDQGHDHDQGLDHNQGQAGPGPGPP